MLCSRDMRLRLYICNRSKDLRHKLRHHSHLLLLESLIALHKFTKFFNLSGLRIHLLFLRF